MDAFSFEYVIGDDGMLEKNTVTEQKEPKPEPRSEARPEPKPEAESKPEPEPRPQEPAARRGGITGPVPVAGIQAGGKVEMINRSISLPEFLEQYNNKTFQTKSCRYVSLRGNGEYERYSIGKYETARNMVFDFAMKRLDEMGEEYISLINREVGGRNPIFITEEEYAENKRQKKNMSYKAVTSEAARGYYMCTNFSEYDWLRNTLRKQLNALRWPMEMFYLEIES